MGSGTGPSEADRASAGLAEHLLNEDSRLVEARSVLEGEQMSVLSLDLFDTLVWRVVPEPTDAFLLLGHRLQETKVLPPEVPPALFARLRPLAEVRARRKLSPTATAEVHLEAIWREMPAHLRGGATPKEMASREVEFEKEITFPDLEVIGLALLAQDKLGLRIVIVSDTYYSEDDIRSILDREPFTGLDVAKVFTSSDVGVGKGSGLYDVVLDALDVAPQEVLHIGDNAEADVKHAEGADIRTVFFDKLPYSFGTVLERERRVRSGPNGSSFLHPVQGDLGLTSLRSKIACRGRHAVTGADDSPYWRFGATVLGPVFVGFAEWIHRRAQEEGVSTVFCAMREGDFLARLIAGAGGYLGSNVEARTIWLSRDVCARAAIFEASSEELTAFLNRRRAPTLRDFCTTLGIEPGLFPQRFNDAEGRLDEPGLRQRVLDAIEARPDVKAAIVMRSAVLRTRLAEYFMRTVGPGTEKVLLADLGWSGTIQGYLARALQGAGVDIETMGLYVLTHELATERMLDGVRLEGFLATGGLPEAARWIVRSPEIMEQVCMFDEGSLVDFDAEANPIRGPAHQSAVQTLQRTAVQAGVLAFQAEWARYDDVLPVPRRQFAEEARGLLLRSLVRFVVEPTVEEATIFGSWLHQEDYGSRTSETMIQDDLAPSLRYMTPKQFLDLPMSRVYWPFGLAAIFDPPIAASAAAVVQGELPAEAFESHQAVPVQILVDLGEGFVGGAAPAAHVNRNGLCFVGEEILAGPVRALRISFPGGPAVVRIDAIRLWLSSRGRADPEVVEFRWPHQFGQLTYEGCSVLSGNLLHGTSGLSIVYRIPPEVGPDVYRVRLEMDFAWLPTSPDAPWELSVKETIRRLGRRVAKRVLSTVIETGGRLVAPNANLTLDGLRRKWQLGGRTDESDESDDDQERR